jgi:hypothetical protein
LNDSPYARRVVALIDEPRPAEASHRAELQRVLGDRLFVLDGPSMEACVPASVYTKAGRERPADLAQIAAITASGDYKQLRDFKRDLSVALADRMTVDDLNNMPIVKAAAVKASTF